MSAPTDSSLLLLAHDPPGRRPAVAGRWVQRDGCLVRFTHGTVPGTQRIHEHRLPNDRIAERFAHALLRTGVNGGAAALDPVEWAGWQHEDGGSVSPPRIIVEAIHLSDRSTG